ncbi:adenylate/guanylate cyclase domain-containing protein [Robertkochia sediminum]|uniref:adenylate/guanylate cyclase domain-containing protein n=1 Tax=Robertkochia sediminum TaxID=2785326 RepID=UPI0019340EF0|nr:adenylate/guanylate cyclase domain-containing protein [Robertkochia sediminum]MBL7473364.1 tetratricopeptide repeat protein [Robertkochia sediminum]
MKTLLPHSIKTLITVMTFVIAGGLTVTKVSAQGKVEVDSLLNAYYGGKQNTEERIQTLLELSYNGIIPPEDRLKYADSLIQMGKKFGLPKRVFNGYMNKSYAYYDMSDFEGNIRESLIALELADSLNNGYQGALYDNLAYTYSKVNNPTEAERYFRKALELHLNQEEKDYEHLGKSYFNISDFYLRQNKLDSAINYLNLAESTFAKLGPSPYDSIRDGKATQICLLANLGVYHFKKGDYDKARPLIEQGAQGFQVIWPEASLEYYNYLIDLAQEQKNYKQAESYAKRAAEIGKNTRTNTELAKVYLNLYELELQKKDYKTALEYYQTHRAYYDSAINLPTIQRMSNMRNAFEMANKQKEVDLMAKEAEIQQLQAKRQRTISYISVGLVVLLGLLIFGLFNRMKYVRKTSRIIEIEKNRSDKLLRNILPDETASELKNYGKVKAKQFESVTVLFADFQGFTKYSENMDPEELVNRVDFYFSKFDEIMERFDLEKIKTMGDAYMCAGGLPFPTEDHATRMIMAAFEIIDFVEQVKNENPDDPTRFRIRVGINTGPVVAGVVGTKKFVYDIWGDTVNIAARMESNSIPGHINISENTYHLIKDRFDCTYRGEVDVKNKGMMRMYYVNPINSSQRNEVIREMSISQTS